MGTYYGNLPGVHPVIYEGVHHRVWHGEPVESQIYVLGIFAKYHVRVVVDVNEIGVIWEPTYSEYEDHQYEHFDYLKNITH